VAIICKVKATEGDGSFAISRRRYLVQDWITSSRVVVSLRASAGRLGAIYSLSYSTDEP
jgi:hypothetical protein